MPSADEYLRAWEWELRAADSSPHTLRTYLTRIRHHLAWLEARQESPDSATKRSVTAYLLERRDTAAAKTVHTDWCALRSFYRWLVAEGDIASSPHGERACPQDDAPPVKVLSVAELRRLLAACAGSRVL